MTSTPTPDVVALARRLYAAGEPVKEILAQTGLSLGTFYRCRNGDFADGSNIKPAPLPPRRAGVRVRHRMGSRAALVKRMWRTAERQVEEIEDRLKTAGLELAERESNARTLSIVAKTLRELAAVDDAGKARSKDANTDDDNDAVPRNVEDLRRALAQKLEAFVDSRSAAVSGDVKRQGN